MLETVKLNQVVYIRTHNCNKGETQAKVTRITKTRVMAGGKSFSKKTGKCIGLPFYAHLIGLESQVTQGRKEKVIYNVTSPETGIIHRWDKKPFEFVGIECALLQCKEFKRLHGFDFVPIKAQ